MTKNIILSVFCQGKNCPPQKRLLKKPVFYRGVSINQLIDTEVVIITPVDNHERKEELLERCFDTPCEHGLENTGLKMLSDACGITNATMLYYFGSKDNIIIKATAHCMAKVENDFMAQAPASFADIERFLREMPYLTAKLHGAKYRFMYQVYASPKYREYGKEFFKGVNIRYHNYAELLSGKLGMPADFIQGMTYLFVRACVHFALFEDEDYLQLQLNAIRTSLRAFIAMKIGSENWKAGGTHEHSGWTSHSSDH